MGRLLVWLSAQLLNASVNLVLCPCGGVQRLLVQASPDVLRLLVVVILLRLFAHLSLLPPTQPLLHVLIAGFSLLLFLVCHLQQGLAQFLLCLSYQFPLQTTLSLLHFQPLFVAKRRLTYDCISRLTLHQFPGLSLIAQSGFI